MERSPACHSVYTECEKLIDDETVVLSPCHIGVLEQAINLIMVGSYGRAAELVEQVRKGQIDPVVMQEAATRPTMSRKALKAFLHSVAC